MFHLQGNLLLWSYLLKNVCVSAIRIPNHCKVFWDVHWGGEEAGVGGGNTCISNRGQAILVNFLCLYFFFLANLCGVSFGPFLCSGSLALKVMELAWRGPLKFYRRPKAFRHMEDL